VRDFGIWHGAGWTFIIFGALHGLGLILNHVWKKYKLFMWRPMGYFLTGILILTANVFFRAESISDALKVFEAMLGFNGIIFVNFVTDTEVQRIARIIRFFIPTINLKTELPYVLAISSLIIFICPNSNRIVDKKFSWLSFLFILVLLALSIFSLSKASDFVYFQF